MKKGFQGFLLFFVLLNYLLPAQENKIKLFSVQECVDYALKNNDNIRVLEALGVKYEEYLKKSAFETPKTTVQYTQGQFNSIYKYDNNITISQSIPFPTVFAANKALHNESTKSAVYNLQASKADLIYQIKATYYSLMYTQALHDLLHKEDSIYVDFAEITLEKFKKGEVGLLDKTGTETQVMEIKNQLIENEEDFFNFQIQLQTLMNYPDPVNVSSDYKDEGQLSIVIDTNMNLEHPILKYLRQQETVTDKIKKYESSKILPDITLAYFNQSIYGPANVFGEDYFLTTKNRLQGFQVGMTLPIWYKPLKAKIDALDLHTDMAKATFEHNQTVMKGQYKQALVQYSKYQNSINYYKSNALNNSALLIGQALESYKKKEISYVEYLDIVSKALDIESNYLGVLHQNNLTILKLQYLLEK